jgi:hypothetical protein
MEPILFFYGSWAIEVMSIIPGLSARFNIWDYSTDTKIGTYPAAAGLPISIDRTQWHISFEWLSPGASWQPMDPRKMSAEFSIVSGLLVNVGAARSQDFGDLVVQFRNLDPQINAFVPITNIPDFTYPERPKVS